MNQSTQEKPDGSKGVLVENKKSIGGVKEMTGFVFTKDKNSSVYYVWIPFYKPDFIIHKEEGQLETYLKGRPLRGKWISFFPNKFWDVDENSELKIINDRLPTRRVGQHYQIFVSCTFNPSKWNKRSAPVLENQFFDLVEDHHNVLEHYKKMDGFVDESCWVQISNHPTTKTRFVLATTQNQWLFSLPNGKPKTPNNEHKFVGKNGYGRNSDSSEKAWDPSELLQPVSDDESESGTEVCDKIDAMALVEKESRSIVDQKMPQNAYGEPVSKILHSVINPLESTPIETEKETQAHDNFCALQYGCEPSSSKISDNYIDHVDPFGFTTTVHETDTSSMPLIESDPHDPDYLYIGYGFPKNEWE